MQWSVLHLRIHRYGANVHGHKRMTRLLVDVNVLQEPCRITIYFGTLFNVLVCADIDNHLGQSLSVIIGLSTPSVLSPYSLLEHDLAVSFPPYVYILSHLFVSMVYSWYHRPKMSATLISDSQGHHITAHLLLLS